MKENCLKCSNYMRCSVKQKGPSYVCNNFARHEGSSLLFPGLTESQETRLTQGLEKAAGVNPASLPDNFDVVSLMRNAEDPLTGTMRDLKIDDGDLPLAKNFFEFSTTMLGPIKPPFARQMWVGWKLFAEYCPRCSDPEWDEVTGVPVDFKPKDIPDHIQFLDYGVCPNCGATKWELHQAGELDLPTEAVLDLGQRSGKSTISAMFSGYHTHRFLKIPKFSTFAQGIQDFSPLTGTFVALTFSRAFKLLWEPFTKIIEASPWFQDYFSMLDHYGEKYGKELYKKKDIFMRFHHKNLDFYPSGPLKRTLRGDTRLSAVVDEIGWFPVANSAEDEDDDDERERAHADEVHNSLTRSLATVQTESLALLSKGMNHIPTGLMISSSSPASERDKITRLYKQSLTSKQMVGINLPTWEINPLFRRDNPVIVEAYRKNPEKAERDFGAKPPRISSAFMKKDVLDGAFVLTNSHKLEYDYSIPKEVFGKSMMRQQIFQPSVMAIDAGYSNNSFCIVVGHYDFISSKVKVTTIIEVMPTDKRRINFNKVYQNIIIPVAKETNSKFLFADRWNSLDILHRAKDDIPGLESKQYSVKMKDFEMVHSMFQEKSIILPKMEIQDTEKIELVEDFRDLKGSPVSHFYLQCITVKEIGGTVDKGEGFTDDIFRAFSLMVTKMMDPKVLEKLKEFSKSTAQQGVGSNMPVSIGRSSGVILNSSGQAVSGSMHGGTNMPVISSRSR